MILLFSRLHLIEAVIFLLIKTEKPELSASRRIMHLCPDIHRREGFFKRRAEGKVLSAFGWCMFMGYIILFPKH